MEIIRRDEIGLNRLADMLALGGFPARRPPAPRDHSKWHVTSLLRSAHDISRGNTVYSDGGESESGIMSFGRIWEFVADSFFSSHAVFEGGIYIPDVVVGCDSVVGSLDGWLQLPPAEGIPAVAAVCESKLRFTLNEEIPLSHAQQIRAYCHMSSTLLAYYLTCHVSSAPSTARCLLRLLRFTPTELSETWELITNTKRYLEKNGIHPEGR